jgi:uncharacterized membrane-anchored protein
MGAAMHNVFTIEVEAEMRRQELERAAVADLRAAQTGPAKRNRTWLARAFRSQPNMPALASPGISVSALLELPRVPRPVAC